jgi:hypothetical protein
MPRDDSDEEEIRTTEKTARLALTNLPWRKITAQDIYGMVAKVCEDRADDLDSVTVYLSHYGQEHPAEDEVEPADGLDEEALQVIWRRHEKHDMKRYFAICQFHNEDTPDRIARVVSGCEIEDSGTFFDFSVVPDDLNLSSFPVRDTADTVKDDWAMPKIETPWMSRSKIVDGWDESSSERKRAIGAAWEAPGSEEDQIISELLIGSGSEDEERPQRGDLEGTLFALNAEEEDEEEDEIQVDFVENGREEEEEEVLEKKRKKTRKERKEEKEPDVEAVDEIMNDARFSDLFVKSGYGVDASDPRFKRSVAMDKFMGEVAKRHHEAGDLVDKRNPKRFPGSKGKSANGE